MALNKALVDAFIAPAHERERWLGGQFAHPRVIERLPLRREQHHRAAPHTGSLLARTYMRQRRSQRFGHHHHAGTAAVGTVINAAVRILGEIARAGKGDVAQAARKGARRDAAFRQGVKRLRKQRDDIKAARLHGRSGNVHVRVTSLFASRR